MLLEADSSVINTKRIDGVCCNVIFLCHVNNEQDRLDLRRDGMGVWNEGHRRVKIPFNNGLKVSDSCCDSYVWRQVFTCKAYKKLKKTEIYRRDTEGKLLSPVFVQYCFDGAPTTVSVLPHGNSKGTLPFYPSDCSLLADMREQVSGPQSQPSQVYGKVSI